MRHTRTLALDLANFVYLLIGDVDIYSASSPPATKTGKLGAFFAFDRKKTLHARSWIRAHILRQIHGVLIFSAFILRYFLKLSRYKHQNIKKTQY